MKDLGIWHVVAQLCEINSMLPYFSQPSNSKLPEDELVEIDLQLIPAGWKRTMTWANFKPLKHSMEELVEYLAGVECSEIKNPPEKNNRNNNKSSGLKKTKKGKRKHDEDKKSQDILDNNASSKKNRKHCKLCRMFGGNAKMHTTECCNKKNLLS
eukprot:8721899-Ditylum_brightwellii.AAC.1